MLWKMASIINCRNGEEVSYNKHKPLIHQNFGNYEIFTLVRLKSHLLHS